MKRMFFCGFFLAVAFQTGAAGTMSRVVGVLDGRTVVVETAGATAEIELRGVEIRPVDERLAVIHLRSLVGGKWVYVENGEMYRSPDGLFVNREMSRRAWLGYTYLGEVALAGPPPRPPAVKQPKAPVDRPAKTTPPRPRRRPRG